MESSSLGVVSNHTDLDNGLYEKNVNDLDSLNGASAINEKQTKQARVRRKWTQEEDEKLRILVSQWGDQSGKNGHWDKISAEFDNRTNKDCRKRWFHSLDPKLKRGRWTEREDQILIEAYKRFGPAWNKIAQLIPGRTDDQCSKRYNDVLDPKIFDRLRPWSPEEDAKLLQLVDQLGTQWRGIAKELDGRTGLTCRNRWKKLISPAAKKMNEESNESDDVIDEIAGPPQKRIKHLSDDGKDDLQESDSMLDHDHTMNIDAPRFSTSLYSLQQPDGDQRSLSEADVDAIVAKAESTGQKVIIIQNTYHYHYHTSSTSNPQLTTRQPPLRGLQPSEMPPISTIPNLHSPSDISSRQSFPPATPGFLELELLEMADDGFPSYEAKDDLAGFHIPFNPS